MRPRDSALVLGIMSGTSIDGVDYALCAVGERSCALRALWHVPFPAALRRRLHAAARDAASSWELARLHHELGRFYAAGADRGPRLRPALVGLHGQTVFHDPDPRAPATLQIGEAAYLAEALRVPVVSNFRVADLAAGGQGAPLATLFHVRAFGRRGRHMAVNNLGGISNVTSIDWRGGGAPRVLAFDTGPANVLLDLAVARFTAGRRRFDRDGRWAARGRPCAPLVERWLAHPYLLRPPPKSTGRETFGEPFLERALVQAQRRGLSEADMLASFVELTARSLADSYRRFLPAPPEAVVLGGGGSANRTLVARIGAWVGQLDGAPRLWTSEELGWPRQAIEPAAFALLGWLRWRGRPGNLPSTTGARREVPCGQLSLATPGRTP